jgi:hypothetical protein
MVVKIVYMGAIVHKEYDINNILKECYPQRIKAQMSVKACMDNRRHLIPWFSCPQGQKLPALGSTSHLKNVSVSASRLNIHHHHHHHHQQHHDSSRSSSTAAPTPVSACFPVLNNNNNNTSNNNNNVLDSSSPLQRLDPHGRRLPLTPAGKNNLSSISAGENHSIHKSVKHLQFKHAYTVKGNLFCFILVYVT